MLKDILAALTGQHLRWSRRDKVLRNVARECTLWVSENWSKQSLISYERVFVLRIEDWERFIAVYLRTVWLAMCLVGRLTQKSVAVKGPKEFPNCSALTLRIGISLSHSSLYGKTTV